MSIITKIKAAIGETKVLEGSQLAESYYHIWKMDEPLKAKALLLPTSTSDVSAIMRLCHAEGQAIIVFGGRTNLVGGTETKGHELIISMEKMNKIIELDEASRTMSVEAGVILENVHIAAHDAQLLFPLNFGAKGSAQLGGIIASNAGGLRVVRYGMTRNLVLGLEVVLADGTVLSSMKKIIKDNSAYDLKQLFIGSEGTLGIITQAVLRLSEAPKSRNSAFIGVNTYTEVIALLKHMDAGLAGTMSGFELIWKNTYVTMTSAPALAKPPIEQSYNYYVLVESLGSNQATDRAVMENLLEEALEKELIADAVLADTQSDLDWFWKIREDVHVLVTACTYDQHFDISLPIPLIGPTITAITDRLWQVEGVEQVFPFGHVADGNVHFIIGKANESTELKDEINDIIYSPLTSIGGSVSAEHGIGLHKKKYLSLCRSEAEIALMQQLKKTMDPLGILNPGKVLDSL